MDYVGYTDEQAQNAILDSISKRLQKGMALSNHKRAVAWVTEMGLPYRISLEYMKADIDIMEIPIQRWYPMPKIPKVAELSKEEKTNKRKKELMDNGTWLDLITEFTGETTDDGKRVCTFKTCDDEVYLQEQAEIERKATEKAKPFLPWNLETPQGIQAWEYLFAWRIAEYEGVIPSWNSFNMFGDTKHSEKELQERKAYYLDLIQRFKVDTQGLYDTSPRIKQVADYELYNFSGSYMWQDDFYIKADSPLDKAPNHPQALQIMKYEKAIKEQRNIDMGREYKNECANQYSMLYRINQIIESLEQANNEP